MYKGIVRGLLPVLFFVVLNAQAQQIKPQGQFLNDSIKIGVPIGYSLSVKYPKGVDVVFPDSLYDYSPYELDHKRYFPTQSDSTHSYDSAIYYITSFEIDTIQHLKLPIFVLHGKDSTTVYADTDAAILQQLVTEIPDSVAVEAMPLKENTTYKNVGLQFNYPYFIIGVGILAILTILFFVLFGGRLKKHFKLKRLKRANNRFIEKYDTLVLNENETEKNKAEKVLILWKKYLEKLESKPYTQLTTKEIIQFYKPKSIGDSLKALDRVIYGNLSVNGEIMKQYTVLKKYAQEKFMEKVEEVKHG
ncbi:hypothetical protein JMN32_06650 [Fulvivirga sp. 29W222]|uniref:DUF4129 domain-containing protein n=1 Tax=Fulvivirga marina TaxID=2494733 RepID=A0A937FX35_9BACT|nr:hypothetical protein [Fulvivirga marina]MBL6445980.1 hypothetical protein [Fulvivirga marina]